MAQSYVGKHAISKGIGRAIRKFVAFAFSAHVLGQRRRACAVPDIQSEHRTSCAARCETFFRRQTRSAGKPSLGKFKSSASWFSAATEKPDGSRLPGWEGKRLRDAVRYGSMRHGAREERGRSALRKTGSGRPAIQVNKGLAALN
jgi:hypothetical protein